MPIAPTYPGVYVEELSSGVHTITGVATSIAAFVGYTKQGIDNRAEHIFSFSDYERLFGGLASDSELSYAVQQFFLNGGTEAYVVRAPAAGATRAAVGFNDSTTTWEFKALSSGSWANSQVLLDVDFLQLSQLVQGSLTVKGNSATVTGAGTAFTALEPNQWLVFDSDATHTPYQIKSIESDTSLTLVSKFAAANASTTAVVCDDPTAFNLTITNLLDGVIESFPAASLDSNSSHYLPAVLNDPDTGSQLVNVTAKTPRVGAAGGEAPAPTGVVGTPATIGSIVSQLCGGNLLAGKVAVASGSPDVVGTGKTFTSMQTGQWLIFASDTTSAAYLVSRIVDDTHLTLASGFAGASNPSTKATVLKMAIINDFHVGISVLAPLPAPAPLPMAVKLFSANSAPPLTLMGLAAQLQSAINGALALKMPGASMAVSVATWGTAPALRLNGVLPGYPDAVFTFPPPGGSLVDASPILGIDPGSVSVSNVGHYALGTGHVYGLQTESAPGVDGSGTGLPGTAELIGDAGANPPTGIYALDKVDLFNILCIPDATRALPGNPNSLDSTVDPNAICAEAIAYCDKRRAFLLLDCPPNINNVSAAVDWKTTLLTVHDKNGAAYFPRLRLPDPLNKFQLRTFAPCGVVAGLYARIDATRGVWKAPAGIEATLSGVQSMTYKLTDPENGALNPLGLNCARTFPVYGSVMWGARTLVGADAEADEWKYIPVRRVALFIEESLYRGTKWVVFEPNDEPLWAQIRLNVGAFMHDLFRQGAFQGQTPKDAYFVKCDKETTTQNDTNLGIVNILVGFAPLKPAEFVFIKIQQLAGQIQT